MTSAVLLTTAPILYCIVITIMYCIIFRTMLYIPVLLLLNKCSFIQMFRNSVLSDFPCEFLVEWLACTTSATP